MNWWYTGYVEFVFIYDTVKSSESAANNVSNRFHGDSNFATERLVWMQD